MGNVLSVYRMIKTVADIVKTGKWVATQYSDPTVVYYREMAIDLGIDVGNELKNVYKGMWGLAHEFSRGSI